MTRRISVLVALGLTLGLSATAALASKHSNDIAPVEYPTADTLSQPTKTNHTSAAPAPEDQANRTPSEYSQDGQNSQPKDNVIDTLQKTVQKEAKALEENSSAHLQIQESLAIGRFIGIISAGNTIFIAFSMAYIIILMRALTRKDAWSESEFQAVLTAISKLETTVKARILDRKHEDINIKPPRNTHNSAVPPYELDNLAFRDKVSESVLLPADFPRTDRKWFENRDSNILKAINDGFNASNTWKQRAIEAVVRFLSHLSTLPLVDKVDFQTAIDKAHSENISAALDAATTTLTAYSHHLGKDTLTTWVAHKDQLKENVRELEDNNTKLRKYIQVLQNCSALRGLELDEKDTYRYFENEPEPWRQWRTILTRLWEALQNCQVAASRLKIVNLQELCANLGRERPFMIDGAVTNPNDALKLHICKTWLRDIFPIFHADALLHAYVDSPSGLLDVAALSTVKLALRLAVLELRALMQHLSLEPEEVRLLLPKPEPSRTVIVSASQGSVPVPVDLRETAEYKSRLNAAVAKYGREVVVYVDIWGVKGCNSLSETKLLFRNREGA